MVDVEGNAASTPKRGRGRGGLGRGLGALIPSSSDERGKTSARPLDVLFPDLVGNSDEGNGTNSVARGGSARDLLVPASTKTSVSRETIAKTRRDAVDSNQLSGLKQTRQAAVARENGLNSHRNVDNQSRSEFGSDVRGSIPSKPSAERTKNGDSSVIAQTTEIVSRETIDKEPESSQSQQGSSQDQRSDVSAIDVTDVRGGTTSGKSNTTISGNYVNEVSAEGLVEKTPDIGTEGELGPVPGATYGLIDPTWVIPNLKQPRHVFGEEELQDLAGSIREVGVLQPIVVRRITEQTLLEEGQEERLKEALQAQPEARYELIMGERRWRASQIAGLDQVPAIIRSTDEDELLREALIENMHRVQLNPLEEAAAYSQLMEDFGYTQEELSKRISKSRPQIANTLRLLKLPPAVQRQLAAGILSAGHARALLSLESPQEMERIAARIIAEGLSVRAVEEQIRFGKKPGERKKREPKIAPPAAQRVADAVAGLLETSVSISGSAKRGKLVIEYADQDDLDRIAAALGL